MTCADNPPPRLACTLSPDRFSARKELIDALLRSGIEHVTKLPGGVRARFVPGPQIEAQLAALAKLEAECCAFLSITLHTTDDTLVLDITGPAEAQSLIAQLFSRRTDTSG